MSKASVVEPSAARSKGRFGRPRGSADADPGVGEPPAAASGGASKRTTTVMIGLTSAASAINYASSLVFSRLLSPGSYGDLTALLALTLIVAVPTGAAQTVVAARIATYRAQGEPDRIGYLIRHALAHVGLIASVLTLVYIAAIPLFASWLNLETTGPALASAPLIGLSFFMPLAFGILQGLDRFVALGGVILLIAVSRIAFGVPWILADGGAGGALGGLAVGNALALVLTAYLARRHLVGRGTGAAKAGLRRKPDKRSLSASGTFIAFAILSNLDVLLAKLFLPATESGYYGALATIGKIVIFLPGAIAVVMVPSAARAQVSDGSARRVLRIAALLVLGATLVVVIPAAIEPSFVIESMFGARYLDAAGGVVPIVLAGSGLALINVLVVYTVAIQDRRWTWLLAGSVLLQIGAISLLHRSATEVAWVQFGVILATLVVNEIVFQPLLRAERWVLRGNRGSEHE